MKEIKAVIRPNKLSSLRETLRAIPGFPGMTVSRVEGCSAPSVHRPSNLKEELTDFSPKIRIEIVAPDEVVDDLVEAISRISQSGSLGDGIIWVADVQRAVFLYKGTACSRPE